MIGGRPKASGGEKYGLSASSPSHSTQISYPTSLCNCRLETAFGDEHFNHESRRRIRRGWTSRPHEAGFPRSTGVDTSADLVSSCTLPQESSAIVGRVRVSDRPNSWRAMQPRRRTTLRNLLRSRSPPHPSQFVGVITLTARYDVVRRTLRIRLMLQRSAPSSRE